MHKALYVAILAISVCFVSCSKEPKQEMWRHPRTDFNLPLLSGPRQMGIPIFNAPTTAEMDKLREEVGFDKQTQTKILDVIRGFNTFMKSNVLKVQKEELNIREELLKERPDLLYVKKCIQNKTQLFAEVEFNQIQRDLDIKELLTKEQYENWMSAVAEKMPGMRGQKMHSGHLPPSDRMPPPMPELDHE